MRWWVLGLTIMAFGLRLWQIDSVPPGFRDDELINSFVISQKVLDGDWRLYYPDASGHEALYHALTAGTIKLFGFSPLGIRGISVVLGTLAVPLTYAVGQILFNKRVGVLAAALVTVSFWSLMYSRIGIRHISQPPFMLGAFWLFWRGLRGDWRNLIGAGMVIGVGAYTYFASWVTPLTIGAFCVYLLIFDRPLLYSKLKGILAMATLAVVLIVPLLVSVSGLPSDEDGSRVEEVAKPLADARAGDFSTLFDHFGQTFLMFSHVGDSEWLYNIAGRVIFHPFVGLVFWIGVGLCIWQIFRHKRDKRQVHHPSAFIFIWWMGGIAPSWVSVPVGSLGHTIGAMSAVYILLAYAVYWGSEKLGARGWWAAAGLLVCLIGWRDLGDYFVRWPQSGNVRFLYRADIREAGLFLRETAGLEDVAISGLLAGPWDRLAMETVTPDTIRARWFDPTRALMLEPNSLVTGYPEIDPVFKPIPLNDSQQVGGYEVFESAYDLNGKGVNLRFQNGLELKSYRYSPPHLDLVWGVNDPFLLPEIPIISNPPPAGVDARPRLSTFTQTLDSAGAFIAGDDGFWVDPVTLQAGDKWIQRHYLERTEQAVLIAIGLYDPQTGNRILTESGEDHLSINLRP